MHEIGSINYQIGVILNNYKHGRSSELFRIDDFIATPCRID